MRTSTDEICSSGVLRVVDGIADLAGDVTKVARVSLFGLGFPASFDDPDETYGSESANDYAWEETGGEGAAVE